MARDDGFWDDNDDDFDDEDDDGPIMLGPAGDDEDEDDEPDLGPDEHDMDLMDGSWEADYYSGRQRVRNWNAIGAGVAIVIVLAFLIPMILTLFR